MIRRRSISALITALVLVLASCSRAKVVRVDPALDAAIAPDARPEPLERDAFKATEGPLWIDASPGAGQAAGYLLFSDLEDKRIYKWTPAGQVSVFLDKSGSNGLTIDRGRLIVAAMWDHAVTRIEPDGARTTLANAYEGQRLNGPNDLIAKSDGAVYFTETSVDPSPGAASGTVPFHGVYLIKDGKVQLLDKDPRGAEPNGIALSPDEKILYVAGGLTITAYDVREDDTVTNARVLIDMSREQSSGSTDGMKVDRDGRIYCSGPNGVWIVSPQGTHLGTIVTPDHIANVAFGDADSKSLYMVGGRSVWRIRVNTPGIRPSTVGFGS